MFTNSGTGNSQKNNNNLLHLYGTFLGTLKKHLKDSKDASSLHKWLYFQWCDIIDRCNIN